MVEDEGMVVIMTNCVLSILVGYGVALIEIDNEGLLCCEVNLGNF